MRAVLPQSLFHETALLSINKIHTDYISGANQIAKFSSSPMSPLFAVRSRFLLSAVRNFQGKKKRCFLRRWWWCMAMHWTLLPLIQCCLAQLDSFFSRLSLRDVACFIYPLSSPFVWSFENIVPRAQSLFLAWLLDMVIFAADVFTRKRWKNFIVRNLLGNK